MGLLEDSWEEATSNLDSIVCEKWFDKMKKAYNEEKRTYHNLDYLCKKLHDYHEIKDNLENPQALLLTLFFQKYVF